MPDDYATFLKSKSIASVSCGFASGDINSMLFDFQQDIVQWALRKGRCAIFADCGMGKTAMELEWSAHVSGKTGKPVLNVAPLAVSQQTAREGGWIYFPFRGLHLERSSYCHAANQGYRTALQAVAQRLMHVQARYP